MLAESKLAQATATRAPNLEAQKPQNAAADAVLPFRWPVSQSRNTEESGLPLTCLYGDIPSACVTRCKCNGFRFSRQSGSPRNSSGENYSLGLKGIPAVVIRSKLDLRTNPQFHANGWTVRAGGDSQKGKVGSLPPWGSQFCEFVLMMFGFSGSGFPKSLRSRVNVATFRRIQRETNYLSRF